VITEWLMTMGGGFGQWLVGIIPAIPSDMIVGYLASAAALGGFTGSLTVWVNWAAIALMVGQVLALYFVTFLVRIIRAILGHVPLVGGNG